MSATKTRHSNRFLPGDTQIIGYARSQLTANELRERVKPFLKGNEKTVKEFLSSISYVHGEHGHHAGSCVHIAP